MGCVSHQQQQQSTDSFFLKGVVFCLSNGAGNPQVTFSYKSSSNTSIEWFGANDVFGGFSRPWRGVDRCVWAAR